MKGKEITNAILVGRQMWEGFRVKGKKLFQISGSGRK